jgi:hypothetical protein
MGKLDLNDILANLIEMAKADGEVTQEEEDFLATLRTNIAKFQESIIFATADEQISDDQFHDLIVLRDKILADALEFETGSEEVNNMINELYLEINDFVIPGMLEEEEYKED